MTQLALDLAPRARKRDPQTSHAAAERAAGFAGKHRAAIWNALIDNGPMTPRELAERTGLEYHAIQRRGKEMAESGLITQGPDTRDGQRVWRGIK